MGNVSQSEDIDERRNQNTHDLDRSVGFPAQRRSRPSAAETQSQMIVALRQHIGQLEKECTALTMQVTLLESRNQNLAEQGERLMGQLRKFHQTRLGSKRHLSA